MSKTISNKTLKNVVALSALEKQGYTNNMNGYHIVEDIKHYLGSYINKIELKNNNYWWDTLLLYPTRSDNPTNTILCIMLAYRWKANEIHFVDPENQYYKISTPIHPLPDGWHIRVWWD